MKERVASILGWISAIALTIGVFLAPVAIACAVVAGFVAVLWFLWNIVVQPITGGPIIGYGPMFGLCIFARLLILFIRGK